MFHGHIPAVITVCLLVLTACGPGQQALVEEQSTTIDSLEAELEKWQLRYQAIADSIRFYDDVDSGQYARDMRVLRDRMDRMYFDLGILRDGGRSVATLQADNLFEPASATLTETGQGRLDEVAEQLQTTYQNRPLRIEGHADNVPVSGSLAEKYPSNWELSGARASSVARYLIEQHELSPDRIKVVALADTAPVASNNSASGRQQNRRVRIAVMPPPLDHVRAYDEAW